MRASALGLPDREVNRLVLANKSSAGSGGGCHTGSASSAHFACGASHQLGAGPATSLVLASPATAWCWQNTPGAAKTESTPHGGGALPSRPPRGGQSQRQALPLLQARAAPPPRCGMLADGAGHQPCSPVWAATACAAEASAGKRAEAPARGINARSRDRWPLSTGEGRDPSRER